jgi:hypothetical protein
MNESMKEMIHSGTAGFADFREGGKEGVLTLKQAASSLPIHPVILGREGGEVNADGAGISSVRDVSSSQEIVDRMKKQR